MDQLAQMMQAFVAGTDRTMAQVGKIEALLDEHFQDSEMFEDLSPAVASYRPGGGKHLYDEEALAAEFRYALRRLRDEGEIDGQHD